MSYIPSIAIHPGHAVARELDALGVSQKWLSDRTGLSEKQISQIINGEASITAETATRLENAIGGSASFWVNLNANYQTTKARILQKEKAEKEVSLLAGIPYNDFALMGWVEPTRDKPTRVINLWRFFAVNSIEQIPLTQSVAFRQVKAKKINPYALAGWLRAGEIEATSMELPEYRKAKLIAAVPFLRKISYEMPNDFYSQLVSVLGNAGVGLIAIRNPKNTAVNGATRWIGKNPFIQLSLHGRNADRMWFTLFHEIGHILLHGKRDQFIDFDNIEKMPQENEADNFASETLLSSSVFDEFVRKGSYTIEAVNTFADQEKVNPCIIMGRLEHNKLVPYTTFAKHHKKLSWEDE